MKRSRFSEEQIIGILKEHEAGVSVADLCRKHGVSDASIYSAKRPLMDAENPSKAYSAVLSSWQVSSGNCAPQRLGARAGRLGARAGGLGRGWSADRAELALRGAYQTRWQATKCPLLPCFSSGAICRQRGSAMGQRV